VSRRLRNIANENEQIFAAGGYHGPAGFVSLADDVAAAVAATRMFGPEEVPPLTETPAGPGAHCTVTPESSTQAARRLTADGDGPVAVLNFASARNPGGGYLGGAQAQEEALCRVSALYPCLLRAPEYYAHHRGDRDPFYSHRVIHSPGVPVFRTDRGDLMEAPFTVGFLTSPAPNAGVIAERTPERVAEIGPVLDTRAERVLEVAVRHGYRRLVLGAWGCGVFRNDPARVAAAFAGLLTGGGRFVRAVDEVVFAVLDRRGTTRAAFEATFGTA